MTQANTSPFSRRLVFALFAYCFENIYVNNIIFKTRRKCMKSTSRIWTITGLLSGVSTLILLVGLAYGIQDILYPSASSAAVGEVKDNKEDTEKQQPVQKNLNITAIGDSLAKGTGDDKGLGFAGRSIAVLNEQNQEAKLINNLGINGLKTIDLLELLDEKGVKHAIQQSGVILLSIGGNDLFQGAQALQKEGQLPTTAELQKAVKEAGENFKKVVQRLHELNPDAQIVYVSLYNPFADLKEMKKIGNEAVASWNLLAADALASYEGTLIVPTYDLYVNNGSLYLSSDHFHPNADGYQVIAERIAQGIYIETDHK